MTAYRSGPADLDGVRLVVLSGELDASDTEWSEALEASVAEGERVVIDMLNVSFVDSSVVQALVSAYRTASRGGWLRVVYTHHLIRRVVVICGLADLLPQYTSIDSALRGNPSTRRVHDESDVAVHEPVSNGHTVRVPGPRAGRRTDRTDDQSPEPGAPR